MSPFLISTIILHAYQLTGCSPSLQGKLVLWCTICISGGDLGVLTSQSEVQCLAYDVLRVDEELSQYSFTTCDRNSLLVPPYLRKIRTIK